MPSAIRWQTQLIIEASQLLGGILSLGRRKGKIWILLAPASSGNTRVQEKLAPDG
jgi:hypothetical protein